MVVFPIPLTVARSSKGNVLLLGRPMYIHLCVCVYACACVCARVRVCSEIKLPSEAVCVEIVLLIALIDAGNAFLLGAATVVTSRRHWCVVLNHLNPKP